MPTAILGLHPLLFGAGFVGAALWFLFWGAAASSFMPAPWHRMWGLTRIRLLWFLLGGFLGPLGLPFARWWSLRKGFNHETGNLSIEYVLEQGFEAACYHWRPTWIRDEWKRARERQIIEGRR